MKVADWWPEDLEMMRLRLLASYERWQTGGLRTWK